MQSSGMFFKQHGGFISWSDAVANPEMIKTIRWPALKRQERTIEKVLRSYGKDVSLLVDVCRQSIVFETMADLVQCLDVIYHDESVTLWCSCGSRIACRCSTTERRVLVSAT